MKKGTTPFHVDRKGYHVTLDDVPAWICEQCGEPYFEENKVNTIEELVLAVEPQKMQQLALAA